MHKKELKMLFDSGFKKYEEELVAYAKEINAEVVTKPNSSNMTVNCNEGFETLPEFYSFYTIKMNDGISRSCSISHSDGNIYVFPPHSKKYLLVEYEL